MRFLSLVTLVALCVLPAGALAQAVDTDHFPSAGQWPGVLKKIEADNKVLDSCIVSKTDPRSCPWAAQQFLAAIASGDGVEGVDRFYVIGDAINAMISYQTDKGQWGEPERWSSPLETFAAGYGDCEDYAIAKYVAFGRLGIQPDNLRIVVGKYNPKNKSDVELHAVLKFDYGGKQVSLSQGPIDWGKFSSLLLFDHLGVRYATPQVVAAR